MVNNAELHAVLGASGGTGSAIVEELVRRGHRVRAVSRGGRTTAGVESFEADVITVEGAIAACARASVVYHCAQPDYTKWPEEFPPMTNAIIEGAAAAGAKLIFADNLYMYGPTDGPMTEDTPQRATGKKGRTRILMAERLLEAHRSGRVRATLGRSSDYYGPRGTASIAGEQVFDAALQGKWARWPASLDVPHQLNYPEDMARCLVTLGEHEEVDGEVWHLPATGPITGRRFLELVFAEAGRPAKMGVISKTMVQVGGIFSPFIREFGENVYQFERPFVSDASKYEGTFGPFSPIPHPEAVARTVAWFRERRGLALLYTGPEKR